MFEYYKWKLANKTTQNALINPKEQQGLGKKIWLISLLLGVGFSTFTVFAPFGGLLALVPTALAIILIFVWLMTHLKEKPIKKLVVKITYFGLFLILALLLRGVLYGLISVILHQIMQNTHHLGQIAMMIDLITRSIILLITPIIIIMFFRFISNQRMWTKIRFKTYLELFIILALGLLLSAIPNTLVFRSLMLTHMMQFLFFTGINTLLITAVITTCKNRGMLT